MLDISRIWQRAILFAGMAVLASCGGASGGGSRGGAGGTSSAIGSGGTSTGGTGGAGSGGTVGSGGVVGTGGASTGGMGGTGSGGTVGSGGFMGTGGVVASGGMTGSGGTTGVAGDRGSGGGGIGSAGGRGGGAGGGPGPGGQGGDVTCPSRVLAGGNTTHMLQVGPLSRTYVLHVPAKYSGAKPVPLVLDFHGLGSSGASEATGSPYPPQTDADGAITAFPSGAAGPQGTAWNLGSCCVGDVDDVAFARAVVADVAKTACVDPKRVYAVGFSIGGGMTHYLGCHAADVFAAIAPAAADLTKENVGDCAPSRPITVIFFRGTADTNVPYGGGSISGIANMPLTGLGAQMTFQTWAGLDHCTGSPSAADANGCSTYSACDAGVQITLCTKQGGGHEPGNASVAWPVLKNHPMP